ELLDEPASVDTTLNEGEQLDDVESELNRTIQDLTSGLGIRVSVSDYYCDRADAYADTSDFDRAVSDYQSALDLNMGIICGHIGLGDLNRDRDQAEIAIEHYTNGLSFHPNEPILYNRRGAVYLQLGQFGE
ncbi:MAG: hypothetical protein CUN54_10320, partial [Phototrophicales bacterium]